MIAMDDSQINVMPIDQLIDIVSDVCKEHSVAHLSLFGSHAKGTARPRSDIDFIVYGCKDYMSLIDAIEEVPTLRRIDIFDYDDVCSEELREDMDKYGVRIY